MQQLLQPVSAAAACSHSSWMSILVTGQYEPQLPSIYLDVTAEDVVDDGATAEDVDDG